MFSRWGIFNGLERENLSDIMFLEKEIEDFMVSQRRMDMLNGHRYYIGEHDILRRERLARDKNGGQQSVKGLPNNRIVDNQYARMVDQKNNYLLSKPVNFSGDKACVDLVRRILPRDFNSKLRELGEDCLNCGIAWAYIYIDEKGALSVKRLNPFEVLPFWADEAHTRLDMAVRVFTVKSYVGQKQVTEDKVEVYKKDGIDKYTLKGRHLIFEKKESYITDQSGEGYGWGDIPLIAFKQNSKEIPLINRVKSLQDALNEVKSDFINSMQENVHNTVLVIKNYDGQDLGEFRQNLAAYGAVKVRSVDGSGGDVTPLKIEVGADTFISAADMLKKAIIENAKGYDASDDRLKNNPNQMNISSIYSDIDLDACGMENAWKASFNRLFYFVDKLINALGLGEGVTNRIEASFNKDRLINESEIIDCCVKSEDIISRETIVTMHPWVNNPTDEIARLDRG